jgi:hypothetical protein
MFGLEWLGLEWYGFFAKKKADIEREVFEESKSHVKGTIQDISDRRMEYLEADSETAKKAIMEYIRTSYTNFDADKIDNDTVKRFFIKCMTGNY